MGLMLLCNNHQVQTQFHIRRFIRGFVTKGETIYFESRVMAFQHEKLLRGNVTHITNLQDINLDRLTALLPTLLSLENIQT